MRFSKVAKQVLQDHTWNYVVSTAGLVAEFYFAHCRRPEKQASRLLNNLVDEGLFGKQSVMVRPAPIVSEPIFSGIPNDVNPNAGELANLCEKRWAGEPRSTTCYFAKKAASNRLGGFS